MEEGAVHVTALLGGGFDLIFGDEDQVVLPPPAFKEVLEGLSYYRFAVGARNLAQVLEVVQVLLNQELAQKAPLRVERIA